MWDLAFLHGPSHRPRGSGFCTPPKGSYSSVITFNTGASAPRSPSPQVSPYRSFSCSAPWVLLPLGGKKIKSGSQAAKDRGSLGGQDGVLGTKAHYFWSLWLGLWGSQPPLATGPRWSPVPLVPTGLNVSRSQDPSRALVLDWGLARLSQCDNQLMSGAVVP